MPQTLQFYTANAQGQQKNWIPNVANLFHLHCGRNFRCQAPHPFLAADFDGKSAPAKKLAGQEVKIPLGPFVRDHVCLDLESGSAIDGGKFDVEIVPAGTRFLAEIRCDGWNRALTDEESAAFDDLCALMLAGGALGLGGKTTNGYGRYRVVESGYQRLNMTKPQDMEAWLNLSRDGLPGQSLAAKCLARPGRGLTGSLAMPLVCDTPILIGGGAPMLPDGSVSEADIIFALAPWLDYGKKSADWRPVLPGSALKGVLRHAIYRILRDSGLDEAEARERLNGLFGHIKDDEGQCGKLVIEDCPLNTKKPRQFVLAAGGIAAQMRF